MTRSQPLSLKAISIATALVASVSAASAAEPVLNLHFTVGGNWYDPGYMTRKDFETGGSAVLGMRNWPVLPSAYYVTSSGFFDDSPIEDDYEYEIRQFGLGITKIWSWGRLQPYTGGGWERTTAEITPLQFIRPIFTEEEDGAWFGAGVTYRLGAFLSAGIGGRVKIDSTEYEDTPVWSAAGLLGIALPAPE